MYLVTWDGESHLDEARYALSGSIDDMANARLAAEQAVKDGKINVCIWVLSYRVETEAKTVFKAPNGKVD